MSDFKAAAPKDVRPSSGGTLFTRVLLVVNSTLLVCLTLTGYFLLANGFYSKETLSADAERNLFNIYCDEAVRYAAVYIPTTKTEAQDADAEEEIAEYKKRFSSANTVFLFSFEQENPINVTEQNDAQPQTATMPNAAVASGETDMKDAAAAKPISILNNFAVEGLDEQYLTNVKSVSMEDLIRDGADPADFRGFDLTLRYGLREVKSTNTPPHDDFFKLKNYIEILDTMKYPILLLFALSVLAEGWLLSRLCACAVEKHDSMMVQEMNRMPLYILAITYALVMFIGIYMIREPLQNLEDWATFSVLREIRSTLYLFFLLLIVMSWVSSLLITTVRARLAMPQWWKRSIIYRMINQPTVEQRLQFWIGTVITIEFLVFIVVFRILGNGESNDNASVSRLMLTVDILLTLMILLVVYVQGKSTSVYTEATRRVAQEKHGVVPTKGLRGQSLRHVQNINFLSRSASEHMQQRFVNESFSIRLINSVSHGLRDPLTAVAQTVEQLQRGTMDEAQTQQKIHEVDLYSQELKKSIEDLLRIANASAGKMHIELTPTDLCMMIEQTVGEFYDRFMQKNIELVANVPEQTPFINVDGACMWTVFESVLNEFLRYAVRGTRVFLRAECKGGEALLRFRGTVRMDDNAQLDEHLNYGTLDLPTAKVFTEMQNGTFHYKYAQDVLTVNLRFPLCAEGGADFKGAIDG